MGEQLKLNSKDLLIPVMSERDRQIFNVLLTIWLSCLGWFWIWWLQNHHIITVMGMVINSLLLAWETVIPGYYFYFVSRMQRPNPNIPIPRKWKVAMIVTKAPSEPWYIVRKTLEAMLAQKYPHHTWLADEDPQPETIAWCRARGVRISNRKGVAEYHQRSWPRRTKCKEGNLAYFYDKVGYDNYNFVVQLDADHVPAAGYLEAMLRPFVDEKVGYVAAPSICDANTTDSWVVNARLFAEATTHGSLQAGYNNGWAPLCIGSHYAVRTTALRNLGGLGPELAEDHSTTMIMNAHGWKGVFAFDAEAHGEGPTCFSDFLIQEFQWSRSLMKILLSFTPRYWSKLTPKLKFQFLFSQLWYPIFGISMLLGSLLPVIALLNDAPWVKVGYLEFLARLLILSLSCVILVIWISSRGWLRPQEGKVINWETIFFQLARWPWVVFGIFNAIISYIFNREVEFKVTPKSTNKTRLLPLSTLLPYLLIVCGSAIPVILCDRVVEAKGYYLLALITSTVYLVLSISIFWLHIQENTKRPTTAYLKQTVAILCALTLLVAAVTLRFPESIEGAIWMNENKLFATPNQEQIIEPPGKQVAFGVYDPARSFKLRNALIEHKYVYWQYEKATSFIAAVKIAQQLGRFPMITLEPWLWEFTGWHGMNPETLFPDLVSGRYDSTLEAISLAAKDLEPQKILLRWAHEMELVGAYPWAQKDAEKYIAAYHYMVEFFRNMGVTNILWLWSPAGNKEAYSYWPGSDYVDYVGISIYASKALDEAWGHEKSRQFEHLLLEKYWLAEELKKTLIVSEFGVSNDIENRSAWLTNVMSNIHNYPRLKALVYFNQVQPEITPFPIGRPNWSLDRKETKILATSWKRFNKGKMSRKNVEEFLVNV